MLESVADHVRFASDAEHMAWLAGACLLAALFALWADRRRTRRKRIDAVGFMPWTAVFFVCAFAAAGFGAVAAKGLMGGS
jgi:hypothetical protein